MKRKKTEESPAEFWPIPGVDGEPYPPLVQEALDLVAKETFRRKRMECKHLDRKFITGASGVNYRRACRDCHLVVDCEHPEEAQRRQSVRYIGDGVFLEYRECRCGKLIARRVPEHTRQTGTEWLKTAEQERREDRRVSRQLRRLQEETARLRPYTKGTMITSGEVFLVHNARGEPVVMVPAEDRAPDLSWVRTMQGRYYQ